MAIFGTTFGSTFNNQPGGGTPTAGLMNASVDASKSPPRVDLFVNAYGAKASIRRIDPFGSHPVRLAQGVTLSAGDWYGQDFEAPFGMPVTYSVQLDDGTVGSSTSVTVAVTRPWLIHPGIPELSRSVTIADVSERSWAVEQATFRPLASAYPVVVSSVRQSPAGTLSLYAPTVAHKDDLLSMLRTSHVLLLNCPPTLGYDLPYEWLAVGEATEARISPLLGEPARRVTFPFQVVKSPPGGVLATWSWADVLATSNTWATVGSTYSSWADVLRNSQNLPE